ncbi:MAG: DUF2807 domain-containing protein, partial [Ferruginibacter sp.]
KIIADENITSLKIYKNAEAILTSNELNEIQIVGEKTGVENTLVKITTGELSITGLPENLYNDKIVIYIPSKFLSSVYVHGSSTVTSSGFLSNEILDITINGDGKSEIKSNGIISVNTVGDFPLDPASN